jgi:uncharacterized protein YbjT (DUF2867 family)
MNRSNRLRGLSMILVTGAMGNAGSEVVRAVQRQGASVRAFVRDPADARRRLGEGVELVPGDFGDARSVRAALDGVESVFLSGPDDRRRVGWESDLIDAASAAGVRRIVKLSGIGAAPDSPVGPWAWHGQIERHLHQSRVLAVVLRASFFMSNLLAAAGPIAGGAPLAAPAGEARIAMIDPRDVGACAATVLTAAGHDGRTYVLTGPQAVTFADVAQAISAAAGREVSYLALPDEAAKQGLVEAGTPRSVADQIVSIFAALRCGAGEHVTDTVESLTGRPPGDVATFLRRHAHLFTPAIVGATR